ncbi:MAG: CHAT domain-containing protein [Acidimicrobiales bacterium]
MAHRRAPHRRPDAQSGLLQLAHERPEASDRYLTAAAQGLDAPSGAVRAMARYGTILLELSAGRLEAAQAEVPRLLDELTRRTETIDALDIRAAGLELVDIRRLAVAFALAGRDDVLFQILEMHERATFDFALAEHDIGPLRSGLAALRTTVAALDAASVDTAELSDLDRRLKDLDGVRRVDRVLRAGAVPPMPRLGFVAANGRVYRATFDGDDRSFIDIGAAADLESLIRRLRFAVAAASMDPHGSERIDLTAHALQELLFAGITLADGEEYSIRPGQSLISVPWRLLPIARTNRVPLRIGSPYPRRDRAPLPQRILSVSCAGPGEHATTEATAVASHYPEATVLVGKAATPTAFLTACVDHDVVHIAGYQALVQRERLVTTLALGGGPLTMLDLGQVPSVAPIVVVASSRVTAVHSRTHDVNLALAQTLIARGAHEVVVSPVDLAPEHAVAVLPALHAGLAAGQTAVESLELLRFDDPELQRAADCLMCIEADHAAGPGTSAVER